MLMAHAVPEGVTRKPGAQNVKYLIVVLGENVKHIIRDVPKPGQTPSAGFERDDRSQASHCLRSATQDVVLRAVDIDFDEI